jgi:hypothetical protein
MFGDLAKRASAQSAVNQKDNRLQETSAGGTMRPVSAFDGHDE